MKWKLKRKKGCYTQLKVGDATIKIQKAKKDGKWEVKFIKGAIPTWQKVQLTAMLINATFLPIKIVVEVVQMFMS